MSVHIKEKKGVLLIVVGAVVLLFMISASTFFSIMKYQLKKLELSIHNLKAYYLLESACTVAIVDIGNGKIGPPPKWLERDINIPLGEETYPIHYKVSKDGGTWLVQSSVVLGEQKYYLKLGGIRAFPIFIRGRQ